MAYYVMIEKKKGIYEKINIVGLDKFRRNSGFKNDGMSLEEIDNFTGSFLDEKEMKMYLLNNRVLSPEDINKKITIRRKNKDEFIKVMYDPIYMRGLLYLNPSFLERRICSLKDDSLFLKKLIAKYERKYNYSSSIHNIRAILEYRIDSNMDMYTELRNFFSAEIYQRNIEGEVEVDKKTGEVLPKYKSLHDLAAFVLNYDMTLAEKERETVSTKDNGQSTIRVRKRINRNDPMEGQYSFFDE